MQNRTLHYFSLLVGIIFLVPSVILAIYFKYPHFYTAFAFGGWLVLDFIDWKLNNKSILAYFYNHRHRRTFFVLFILSSIFCFVVDYVYGVRLSGMWQWTDYKTIHFIRMYLFMNISYILGMYELFQVIKSLLYKYFFIKIKKNKKPIILSVKNYKLFIILGFIFILLPLYVFILESTLYIEFFMIFPFLGMFAIADGLTGLLGGNSFLAKLLNSHYLYILSIIFTVILGAGITEIINLFGGEWRYLKIPFPEMSIFRIPLAVFVGWVPLVLGSVALVYFIKQLDYVWNNRKK